MSFRAKRGNNLDLLKAFAWKLRPESGLDCLMCAELLADSEVRHFDKAFQLSRQRLDLPIPNMKHLTAARPFFLKAETSIGHDCLMCAKLVGDHEMRYFDGAFLSHRKRLSSFFAEVISCTNPST